MPDPQFVVGPQVHPELLGSSEIPGEPDRGVRADTPLAVHDLVDPSRRNPDGDSDLVLGDSEPLDEIPHEDLAGMDRFDHVLASFAHCDHVANA